MDIVITSILVGLSTFAGTFTFYVNYGIMLSKLWHFLHKK